MATVVTKYGVFDPDRVVRRILLGEKPGTLPKKLLPTNPLLGPPVPLFLGIRWPKHRKH